MKKFRDLLTTDSSKYDIEEWDKRELYHNYERLRSYVIGNSSGIDFDYFTRPKRGVDKNEIIWQSEIFDSNPVSLSSLSGDEYNRYKTILEQKRSILVQFAETLKKTENQWGLLLERALLYGGDHYVFCGDGKIAVAAWSMKPKASPPEKPFEQAKGYPPPVNEADDLGEEPVVPQESEDVSESQEEESEQSQQMPTEPEMETYNNSSQGFYEEPAEQQEQPATIPLSEQLEATDEKEASVPDTDITVHVPPLTPDDNCDAGSVDSSGNHRGGNNDNQNKKKKCSWWKWLFSILAVLLLILFTSLLLKQCLPTGSDLVPAIPILPGEPGKLPPVDPGDIGFDGDSVSKVVTNRLNILLEDTDMEGFASDLKKVYPDDNYQIVYYDTLVRRLQIQLPKDVKDVVRQELPQKLSQYNFIIYDEAIFECNYVPNDPAFNEPRKRWYFDAVKAITAWDITQGHPDIIVAVLDDGFDLSHPEIKERVYKPYNVVSKNNTITYHPEAMGILMVDHGTHTSGTIIGQHDNNIGTSGIAPKCKYMPVQVAYPNGMMTTTSVMDGILYAIYQGADVINISLGMGLNPDIAPLIPEYIQQQIIENEFLEAEKVWNEIYKIAEKFNTVIVYAAGNDNVMTGIDPSKRSDYCIHVSAVDLRSQKAEFSNWGNYSTLSAPGVDIYNAVFNNNYAFLPGTSMAAPIVAGGVALIKSLDRNMRTRDIIHLLQTTGLPVSSRHRTGNLIQLDRALQQLNKKNEPDLQADDCDAIRRKIDSLTCMIEELQLLCPEYGRQQDTLKLKDVVDRPEMLNGRWKSTTTLYNRSMEKVELFFEFDNGCGTLFFIEENGKTCEASVRVSITGNHLEIIQEDSARCPDNTYYRKYLFNCQTDRQGNAECVAVSVDNKLDKVIFNLIKIV